MKTCWKCKRPIHETVVTVVARNGSTRTFHPGCAHSNQSVAQRLSDNVVDIARAKAPKHNVVDIARAKAPKPV